MKPESLILTEIEAETLRFTRTLARLRRALSQARHESKLKQPLWSIATDTLPLATAADRIMESVALVTGIPPHTIRGRARYHQIIAARHTTFWLIRQLLPQFTLEDVGAHFRVKHGTVHHALKSIEARRHTEPPFAAQLETLRAELSAQLRDHLPINLTSHSQPQPQAA